ncbi:hypothetical protein ACFTXM_12595 [Streptomyces sp. NPDC056930]|uniref:hypothetical protein n=1 Tax=Streptomyces sp. NPDC056930 TaxID=3345967 RepID=UPI003628C6E4
MSPSGRPTALAGRAASESEAIDGEEPSVAPSGQSLLPTGVEFLLGPGRIVGLAGQVGELRIGRARSGVAEPQPHGDPQKDVERTNAPQAPAIRRTSGFRTVGSTETGVGAGRRVVRFCILTDCVKAGAVAAAGSAALLSTTPVMCR